MTVVLSVRDLAVRYHGKRGSFQAVEDVGFDLACGETLGIVGESGCGKSTLAKAIMGLVAPNRGSVRLDGVELVHRSRRIPRAHRPKMQMVFQDPYGSLNPRHTVGRTIAEPLVVHGIDTAAGRKERVRAMLDSVGLPAEAASRYPHEFSGGQRQRIAIARALILQPKLIVCDEPVSALDISIQAQILNLLTDVQKQFGMSYLFISHDIEVIEYMAEQVAVMHLGRIVEMASRYELCRHPVHPYTKALMRAASFLPAGREAGTPASTGPDRNDRGHRGDAPAASEGCRFRNQCPMAAERCRLEVPKLRSIGTGHSVACHLP